MDPGEDRRKSGKHAEGNCIGDARQKLSGRCAPDAGNPSEAGEDVDQEIYGDGCIEMRR